MKIALFTDSFLPGIGGTENVVARLAELYSKDDEVMVFAPDYKSNFDDSKLKFKVVRSKSLKFSNSDFWAMPGISKNLKRQLSEFKPDIVHSHTVGMMAGFANKYAKKNNIPSICTVHTNFKVCYKDALKFNFLANILLRHVMKRPKKATAVTTVSNFMAKELKSYGIKQEIQVIRNGGNGKAYQNEVNSGKFVFLFVGYLIEYKNVAFTLKALAEVKKTNSDFIFKIVGAGPDEKNFRRQVKELGLEENVEFLGAIRDREKLNEVYASADVFLFSSVIDTDGIVIEESANAGVPSLVIKGTGASERLTDGVTGFKSEYSVKDYSEKILFLMQQDREFLREVGVSARGVYKSWEDIAKQYKNLYNSLLKEKAGKK